MIMKKYKLKNLTLGLAFLTASVMVMLTVNSCDTPFSGEGVDAKGKLDFTDPAIKNHPDCDPANPANTNCYCDVEDITDTCFVCDLSNSDHYLNPSLTC